MKARVQYGDFTGTASADISDRLRGDLSTIGEYFKLDSERFKIVGVSIYGVSTFSISLLCVDLYKSNSEKEHIISLLISKDMIDDQNILSKLFKRLNVVLHGRFDEKYSAMEYYSEESFSDYHNSSKNE